MPFLSLFTFICYMSNHVVYILIICFFFVVYIPVFRFLERYILYWNTARGVTFLCILHTMDACLRQLQSISCSN